MAIEEPRALGVCDALVQIGRADLAEPILACYRVAGQVNAPARGFPGQGIFDLYRQLAGRGADGRARGSRPWPVEFCMSCDKLIAAGARKGEEIATGYHRHIECAPDVEKRQRIGDRRTFDARTTYQYFDDASRALTEAAKAKKLDIYGFQPGAPGSDFKFSIAELDRTNLDLTTPIIVYEGRRYGVRLFTPEVAAGEATAETSKQKGERRIAGALNDAYAAGELTIASTQKQATAAVRRRLFGKSVVPRGFEDDKIDGVRKAIGLR